MSTTEFAQIEPTTRCNYTCGFCAGRSMRQGDLSWEAFERFLQLNPNLKHVELQGEGEPLIHHRFFDMVAACRARGIKVSLISNGSMLGQRQVDNLIEHAVESIHISLESADPAVFQSIRGGKLSKVIDGISLLMQRRRELGKDRPIVGFCVTVLRRTLGAMHRIVELYKELGLDGGISVQPLQEMSCYTEHYDDEMLKQLVPGELWREYLREFRTAVATIQRRVDTPSYYQALFAGFNPTAGKCPWLERGAYLNIDGNVTGCCFMKSPRHALGNIASDRPEVIAGRRLALAQALYNGVIPQQCSDCAVAKAVAKSPQTRQVSLRVLNL
jgi:MoaA/NifB/PqqE/SkfB family radical SAM enzyme